MPRARHDVFLSHNSADKPAVEELARRLQRAGIALWLDKWNLVPGVPWQAALEEALAACATCAVFIGPSGTGPWQDEEMRAAINRRVTDSNGDFRVIPVLLPGAERGERSKLPTFLTATTWVEFRTTLDDEEALRRLICGIRGVEPGPAPHDAAFAGTTPYRGLQVFDVTDAPFFFGREALIEWLLNEIRPTSSAQNSNRFLGIIGPSGSGKSSLARAGVIAAIKQGQIPGSDQWPVAICRPGADPLESLALAVNAVIGNTQHVSAVRSLIADFRADARTLHLTTRMALQNAPDRRFVVVVDQFEEVWSLCHDDALGQATIDTLLHAATVAGGQTIVILTLRADFYGKCAAYLALATALSDHQLLVGPMTRDELRWAIERPALLVGAEFEPGLIEALLDDVQGQPGSLPLLQHALLELWNRRSGRKLTHAAYREIGGVAGALEQCAETVFNSLTPAEQELCKRIFLRLTQPGEGTEDTRRRATLHELLPANGNTAAVDAVLHKLAGADARLVIIEGGQPTTAAQPRTVQSEAVEVAHEALIRSWGRLRGWIDQNRAALRVHRQITEAAAAWEANNRDASYLYRGARLAEGQEWAVAHTDELNQLERSFLEASVLARELERRAARRRTRWTIGGLMAALLVISGFAGGAVWFWHSAATSERVIRARYLVSEAQNVFSDRPLLGLRLVLEGMAVAPANDLELQNSLYATVRQMAEQGRVQKLASDATDLFQTQDRTRIVFGSNQKAGHIWFANTNTSVPLAGPVYNATFSPDANARYFMVHYADGTPAELRRSADASVIAQLTGNVTSVTFSPDARYFVIEYNYTTAELRRVADASVVAQLPGSLNTVTFSPDARYFMLLHNNNIFPTELRRSVDGSVVPFARPVYYFTFSPDARYFVVQYNDGTSADGTPAQLHRSADAAVIAQLAGSTYTHNVFFSPDGRHFVVIYDTTTAELRRVADGSVIAQLAKSVYTVSFSQNSDYFVITPLGGTPDDLRRTADASVVPFAKPVQSVLFSSYSTPMVHYDVGSSELAMVQYDNGSSELWNMEDRPYSLVNLGIAVSNLAIPLTAQKIVVRYQIGDVYLLDAKWLTAMHGVFAAPSGADLIRLACEGRLKSEYWTQEDQEALESALNGQEPLACK